MKFLHVLAFCFALSISYAQDNKKTTHHTTTSPSTSTTVTPIPTTLPPTPPTTASTTPSTTPAPTTPLTSPSTTPAPTTPSTTPSTTPAPTTSPTTPVPTSTTPTPSSSTTPLPPTNEWIVKDPNTLDICIIAAMDISLHLQAGNASNYSTSDIKVAPATTHVQVDGTCGNETEEFRLMWPLLGVNSTMQVTFTKNKQNYYVSSLHLVLPYNYTNVVKYANFSSVNLTLFETNLNSSYSCGFYEIPEVTNSLKEKVNVKISGLHVEAFRTGKSTNFNSAHYCPGEVPDIVPLVVGICLAGLVLVVVIAYLIGRRRSQNSGYLSM